MTKIVINTCHGGFSLSYIATVEYWKIKGVVVHAYVRVDDPRDDYERVDFGDYTPSEIGDTFDGKMVHYCSLGKRVISSQELNDNYISDRDMKRDDPILIEVVEKFGELSNGDCAELKIVEIPDDIDWEISDHAGSEYVEEQHRRWS